MEMWVINWNGCKMGMFLCADWANSFGKGDSRQEWEAVAAAVWSM